MKISGDPFEQEGSQRLNANGAGNSFGADAFNNATGYTMATMMQASGTAKVQAWNKDAIVAAYRAILVDVDSLKTAINGKNQQAARAALSKLKKDSEALDKLVK